MKSRYIEGGSIPAVISLHGASLGSSADVFERNRGPLAKAGLGIIAYDQPDLHSDNCKHLVHRNAMDQFHRLAASFLPN